MHKPINDINDGVGKGEKWRKRPTKIKAIAWKLISILNTT